MKEEDAMQPYFITRIDGEPLYFAGLNSARVGVGAKDGYGFEIVTDAAEAACPMYTFAAHWSFQRRPPASGWRCRPLSMKRSHSQRI